MTPKRYFQIFYLFTFSVASCNLLVNQFFGDVPLEQYLQDVCAKEQSNSTSQNGNQVLVHLVDNIVDLSTDEIKQPPIVSTSRYYFYLKNLRCEFQYFSQVNYQFLLSKFSTNNETINFLHQTANLLFVFDLLSIRNLTHAMFDQLLKQLNGFYRKCTVCLPVVILLNAQPPSSSQMFHWSNSVIQWLDKEFQSVLIQVNSVNDNATSSMTTSGHQSVWLIHPTLYGCVYHAGVFVPSNERDFHLLRIHPRNCNLNGSQLIVSAADIVPYCKLTITSDHGHNRSSSDPPIQADYSMELNMLRLFERKYNFVSKLKNRKQSPSMLGSDMWQGIGQQLVRRESDLGLCDITVTRRRLGLADFTRHIYVNERSFISNAPRALHSGWALSPEAPTFTRQVWVIFFGVLVVLFALLYPVPLLRSKSDLFTNICAIYLRQSLRSVAVERLTSVRLVYVSVMMASLVLSNFYSSSIYSLLTVPQYEPLVDTVADIERIATTDTHLLLVRGSALEPVVQAATPESNVFFYRVKQHLQRIGMRSPVANNNELIRLVEGDRRFVVFNERLFLIVQRHLLATKPLHIGSGVIRPELISIMLRKRSLLKRPFNRIIYRCHELGLFEHWIRSSLARLPPPKMPRNSLMTNPNQADFSYAKSRDHPEEEQFKSLSVQDLITIFVLWFTGLLIASTRLIGEIVWHRSIDHTDHSSSNTSTVSPLLTVQQRQFTIRPFTG